MTANINYKTGRKKPVLILFILIYILMLLAMFILPFSVTDDLSIIRNTVSELGAQCSEGSWIMNTILVVLAFTSVLSGWSCYEGYIFPRIILILFGVSLSLAAFFNHAPAAIDIHYDINEAGLHSYLISTTWLAFVILAFSTAVILEKHADRLLAIAAGSSSILLSILLSEADNTAGIWQRLLFIISFGWMIYTFETPVNINQRPDNLSKTDS